MSQSFRQTLDKLPVAARYLLIALVVFFISFLFPSHVQFKYQYEKGQVWHYDDLVAPYSFAIQKPPEQLEEEYAAVNAELSPFYNLEAGLSTRQKEAFRKAFDARLSEEGMVDQFPNVSANPRLYEQYGLNFLDVIYDKGVIELAEEHREKGRDFVINIVAGNTSYKRTLEYFFTEQEAAEWLSDSLPYSSLEEPDFLYALLEDHIRPNITYNAPLTQKLEREMLSEVSPMRGMVREGELIVQRGASITQEVFYKLESFKRHYYQEASSRGAMWMVFGGYLLLTSLIVGVFLFYLRAFEPGVFGSLSKLAFVLLWLLLYSYLEYIVSFTAVLSPYVIPFCIVPIVIKTFYDNYLAFVTHIVVVLIASFLTNLGYEFTLLQMLAGIVVILSKVNTRDWSRFFYSMLAIFLTYVIGYLGLSLIQVGDWRDINYTVFGWLFLNVFLTMLAYPLIPLLERLFGFTSAITLMELSDMNRPLLRELAVKAPGTLQHSLQVANLSEAAASRIGADDLLVKVASLYHDIGKTKAPQYFIENQSNGKNPHDELSPKESAIIIIDHVLEGERKAREKRLPKMVIDFIRSHHGTTRTEYFYRKSVERNGEANVDESLFRYPGPIPRTREETIVMLADSIEAACKSLKEPTGQDIDQLIDRIISGKIAQGQLRDSPLSFEELEACQDVFQKLMRSIHHVRIEYPEEPEKNSSQPA